MPMNSTIAAIINGSAPEVIATPVPTPTPIPEWVATSALDWAPVPIAPFNIPLWVIFSLISLGALIVIYFKWSDQSADLDSIKVWYIKASELVAGKIQVIRLSRAGNFIPDCLDIFDNIISYGDSEENINQWKFRSALGVIRVGGVSAALLSEDFDQNRDPITEMAICRASYMLDENIDQFRRDLTLRYEQLKRDKLYDGENPATFVRPVHSYNDYIGKATPSSAPDDKRSGHALFMWMFPEGIPIASYMPWNQVESRKFWPAGNNTSAFLGGENIQIVDDKLLEGEDDKQRGFLEKWGGMLIAGLLCIGFVIAGTAIPL